MSWSEYLAAPQLNNGFIRVWQRNFLQFRKTWLVSAVWIVLEPLMYLGGFGYGLGAFVNNMNGLSFLEFFFPGLLCTTAMFVAFFEGTYSNYSKLTYQKIYSSIMMTRVGPEEIVFGEILWAASKGFAGVCGVTLVAAVFGLVDSMMIFAALPVLFVISWLFACIAMIVTSMARSYDSFIYGTSGFIIPMTLLCGVYFPNEHLPVVLRYLTYLLPLTHGVQAVRGLLTKGFTESFYIHFTILCFMSWVCMNIAIIRLRAKLLR
jgi:lipooligosaccharide transport system permease protein